MVRKKTKVMSSNTSVPPGSLYHTEQWLKTKFRGLQIQFTEKDISPQATTTVVRGGISMETEPVFSQQSQGLLEHKKQCGSACWFSKNRRLGLVPLSGVYVF